MTKCRLYFAAAFLILSLIGAACTADSQDDDGAIRATGFVEGRSYTVISTLGGTIKMVQVEQGDAVDQGDELVQLDDASYLHLHDQAQAGVSFAEARLKAIDEIPSDQEIEQGQGLVAIAQAELDGANASLDLLESLYAPRDVPEAELHQAESAVAIAEAGLVLAQAQQAQIGAGSLEGEKKIAQATLREAQAQLSLVEREVEKLLLVAPVAGKVEEMLAGEGESVMPGSPVVRILDPSYMTIKVYVPESQVATLRIGDSVDITADAYPEEVFHGSIVHIADRAQFTPTLVLTEEERVKLVFEVEVLIEEGLDNLKPGMPVDVEIFP
jgi:HlyD family secretion protein